MTQRAIGNERILPCVLDRLTDDYPKASKESREFRTTTLKKYKQSVLRDLEWLLNCGSYTAQEEFGEFEHVKNSVLNYGIRNMAGRWSSRKNAGYIAEDIRKAIINFEPRIIRHTLEVAIVESESEKSAPGAKVTLEISGELWVEPYPEHLYIKTELDLETGLCEML